jgi:hypothetical protein
LKKRYPDWIGLVPDAGRTVAFVTVFLLCAFQVIAKATAAALLAVTDGGWLLVYMAVDHAALLVYKIARRDYIYNIPMPTVGSYVISPMVRTMFKVVADFTGSMNMRLPFLLGGTYFSANLAMSHVSVFVAVYLYSG